MPDGCSLPRTRSGIWRCPRNYSKTDCSLKTKVTFMPKIGTDDGINLYYEEAGTIVSRLVV
jgi:hypothetical protein